MHHVHPQHHEINDVLNDHFGSNMSHFDWCDVVEITDNVEMFHAKQHFDGIQHLVPLIRVIVKKFHHIFLGTYQVSLSEGHDGSVPDLTKSESQIQGFWRKNLRSLCSPYKPAKSTKLHKRITCVTNENPVHHIFHRPKVHSDAHELYIIVHGMTCGSPQLDVQHVAFWWTVPNEAATCFVDLSGLGPGLTFSKNNHYTTICGNNFWK